MPLARAASTRTKVCRSPFRNDRKPSFSISEDGKLWKDHGTGAGGDVVSFVMRGLNIRLAPDGDDSGRAAAEAWGQAFTDAGSKVEIIRMPEGCDLRDLLESGQLTPEDLFS